MAALDIPTMLPGTDAVVKTARAEDTGVVRPPTFPLPEHLTVAAPLQGGTQSIGATMPPGAVSFGSMPTGFLAPGAAFGPRYHVIRLLGAGGMGAVYQAWDNELGVAVALKVIRPEVMMDPDGARDLERRFKRELLLARQVTHKNVVRIHDLGEIDGIKYITMPYIQGTDLSSRLQREGKLAMPKVLGIARQVAQGLAAAHEAGVVHRDLKPANIMIDEEDRAIIMDFGIARSTSGGATLLGTVVGTLEYMAPEQAMGQAVDHRADIYTFGLILYDLLLGRRSAAGAETAVAELMRRIQRSLPPARSVDQSIPEGVEQIISTCLEPDPALRFQTMVELIAALENVDNDGRVIDQARREATTRRHTRPGLTFPAAPVTPAPSSRPRMFTPARVAAAMVVTVMAIAAGGYFALQSTANPSSSKQPGTITRESPSLAILPFRNATGDPSLEWLGQAVAEMLKGAVPQNRIRTVSSDRVFQVLRDLRVSPDMKVDIGTMKRVGDFSNATTILAGEYVKAGNELRFDAVLRDVRRGVSDTVTTTMTDQRQIMDAAAALGRAIEEKLLADSPLATTGVNTVRPSTQSVDAMRFYSEGIQLGRRGNHLGALKKFEAAVAADGEFALAHAKLAQTYANLGHGADAERASRKAVERAARLGEPERFHVEAVHARILNDQNRAIQAYERLRQLTPGDPEVHFNLAGRYEATGAFDRALAEYLKVLEADPKYFDALFAAGRVEVLRKNPEGALDYFSRALNVAVAIDSDEARASALNATGVAYKRLNKQEDALRYYEESLALRRRLDDKRGVASTLGELGQIHQALGKPDQALERYRESLAIQRQIGNKSGAAITLNNLGLLLQAIGRLDEALTNYKEALQLQTEIGNADYQALALQNIGSTLFAQARYDDAASYLDRALRIREKLNVALLTAETLQTLGDIAVRQAQYEQALERYVKALEMCRTTSDKHCVSFVLVSMGTLFEEQGRYRAALDSKKEAVDALRLTKDEGLVLAEALASHAHGWTLVGKHEEARPLLNQSLVIANRLGAPRLVAQALNYQGEDALLAGNPSAAAALFGQASGKASAAGDRYLIILTKINGAEAALRAGRAAGAATAATAAATEAAQLGIKALTAKAMLVAGEAHIAQRAFAPARSALESALRDSERIGARPLLLRAHHALALSLRAVGQASEAGVHSREAARMLQELQKEAGIDTLLQRADFRSIATEVAPATSPTS